MGADQAVAAAVRARVERFSVLLTARDPLIVDEVWSEGFRLVGSEPGEIAESRAALVALFDKLFARPVRYGFDFARFDVETTGGVAWLFAEGDLVATGADETARHPYRLTAVFVLTGGAWRWRLFSGAEPAKPFAS